MIMAPETLDGTLAPVRHVLLDFDGPVCSVFAGFSAGDVAQSLVALLRGPDGPPPGHEEADPLAMLRRIAETREDLVSAADSHLTQLEVEAVGRARPTPGGVAFMEACAATGRSVWVVSNNATAAIDRYLSDHGLRDLVAGTFGRTAGRPESMKPSPELLIAAMRAADAKPGECVFIGDAVRDVEAAHAADMKTIGYANKPGKADALSAAGAVAVVTSMETLAASVT
ncbi:HAD-IA family hydrolase [Streptomyces solisilvae]|uniref:HAD family hydrolase n=1 Tax=Streptomyces malaysiensis TaxID=92644 RepID=UPI0033344E7B